MILRELPNLRDEPFRREFYRRWGKENCVVMGRACRAEYRPYTQTLSTKAAVGGAETYLFERHQVVVDDDTYLILNEASTYGARIDSRTEVESFAIFFRPAMAREVLSGAATTTDRLLQDPATLSAQPIEFAEQLQWHDRSVTPVLQHLRRQLARGLDDELWLEEQLQFLLQRMLRQHRRDLRRAEQFEALRASTRRELSRRVRQATHFIHAHFDEPLTLHAMAQAAAMSPFHFLRAFARYHGVTPSRYLERKRIAVAARLVAGSEEPMADIAVRVGFDNRGTLYRTWRRWRADRPADLRRH